MKLANMPLVGAGAVVTKKVKPFALIVGNPGRQIGWVSEFGHTLVFKNSQATCPESLMEYELIDNNCRIKKS